MVMGTLMGFPPIIPLQLSEIALVLAIGGVVRTLDFALAGINPV